MSFVGPKKGEKGGFCQSGQGESLCPNVADLIGFSLLIMIEEK